MGVILKYANDKNKQKLIKEILDSQEGIRMGAEVLGTISKDRAEYIRFYQQLKAEIDRDSQLLYAEKKGRLEGKIEGRLEGKIEGMIEVAKNLVKMGLSNSQILEVTGLSIEEVEQLKKDLQ